MSALLMKLLAILPSAVEAGKVLTDREVRKENASRPSTTVAKVGAGAAGVMAISPDIPPEMAVGMAIMSLAAYFYRRRVGCDGPGAGVE